MKHMLPWMALKSKDGFFYVADAHGKKIVTVGDEDEDGQIAEMIAACVNMGGIQWLVFRHVLQMPQLAMQLHGQMAAHVTEQVSHVVEEVKAELEECIDDDPEGGE